MKVLFHNHPSNAPQTAHRVKFRSFLNDWHTSPEQKMDPFTAISLAAAVVQFVDFSTKLISGAREIYTSVSGQTEENRSVESITREMTSLASKLSSAANSQQSEDEKSLYRLAGDCKIVADQILDLLNRIKPRDPRSMRQSAWSALKNKLHEKERAELESRLQNCRNQLGLQLNFIMRFCSRFFSWP